MTFSKAPLIERGFCICGICRRQTMQHAESSDEHDAEALRADCARCAALCCVALAFDRGPMFAFDKAAGVPCPNLSGDNRCAVHARLAAEGMAGCVSYDCLGAGQRVTAMFAGRSWRDDADTARAMFRAFAAMRRAQELVSLLRAAVRLPLSPERARRRADLERECAPAGGWTLLTLERFDRGPIPGKVRAFLASLKDAACVQERLGGDAE